MNRQKSHQHSADGARRTAAAARRAKRKIARKLDRDKRRKAAITNGRTWKPSPSDINRAMARSNGRQSARKHIPRGDIARAEAAKKALPPVKPTEEVA